MFFLPCHFARGKVVGRILHKHWNWGRWLFWFVCFSYFSKTQSITWPILLFYHCFSLSNHFISPGWMFPSINNGDIFQEFWKKVHDSVTTWNYSLLFKDLCFRATQHAWHINAKRTSRILNEECRYHLGHMYWQPTLQSGIDKQFTI